MSKLKGKLAAWLKSRVTRLLLGLFLALVICMIIVGLDNPTGIMLCWAAITVLMAEMTRHWRRVRNFIILAVVSFVGAIILSFLHEEVVVPLTGLLGGQAALNSTGLDVYSEITSFIILLFSPVGIFVGFVGSIILAILRLAGLVSRDGVTST